MKQGHLVVIFLTIYMVCFMALYVEQKKYDHVQREKQRIEQALLEAIETAGKNFEEVINAPEAIRKNTFEKAFLESLYVSMGLFDMEDAQEHLKMYLPMLILAEEDGAFFYYVQEVKNDTTTELRHIWSEKIPYVYSEDNTEGQRIYRVSDTLEKQASYIITNHNYIASQYGISYTFHMPAFFKDMSTEIEFPMMFVVFQGWPLTASGDIMYEKCIDAGVYLREEENYTITGPESLSNAYCVYHKRSCPVIATENVWICRENATLEEAINRFGAFSCSKCFN